jgi:hypothetical protein
MEELKVRHGTRQVVHWAVDSALEEVRFGRAATYGARASAPNTILRRREMPPLKDPDDELQFLDREMKFGRLILDQKMARLVERGLRGIAQSGKIYRNVMPGEAQSILNILDRQRAESVMREAVEPLADTNPPVELPDYDGVEVVVYRRPGSPSCVTPNN